MSSVIDQLAAAIVALPTDRPKRIAIDGRTASGKTTFAAALAQAVEARGRPAILTSIDGFHRSKIERYARGRLSAEGYYRDARDLAAIRRLLLDPLGPGGSRQYATASFDLEADLPIDEPTRLAAQDAILIVDGTFLQRPELAGAWDAVIYIEVPRELATLRGIARDAERLGGPAAATQVYAARYAPAETLYLSECDPLDGADARVDNRDFDQPRLTLAPNGRLARQAN